MITADYAAAQLDALRVALGGVALFAVLALWFTRRLPMGTASAPEPGPGPEPSLEPGVAATA